MTGKLLWIFPLFLLLFVGCKKANLTEDNPSDTEITTMSHITSTSEACKEVLEPDWNDDSTQIPTILGYRLQNNPYSLANMQQASMNLYGHSNGIAVNRKYIRFKPADETQLQTLIDTDIELIDYPLDHYVIQEGDYYNQGLPPQEIPWLYSVVDNSFIPPSGIQYELLEEISIPDNDIALEDEAFRITDNPVDPEGCGEMRTKKDVKKSGRVMVPLCPDGFHWDDVANQCVHDNCYPGFHWDPVTARCEPDPVPQVRQPSGQIEVVDNVLGNVPVRRTRIVLKRFLKIDRVYTNDGGDFQATKSFKNKVNVRVSFKSPDFTARGLRGIRFWQMRFPVSFGIGKFSGNLSQVRHVFEEGTNFNSRRYRNWWAAQLMNSYLEFNAFAQNVGIGRLPTDMVVLLTNWGQAAGAGSTPMNRHRPLNAGTPPREWIEFFVANPALFPNAISLFNFLSNGVFLREIDMTLGYNVNGRRMSDRVKYLMYHEFAHASHFGKVDRQWWNSFVNGVMSTIVTSWGTDFVPYGRGDNGLISDYISVAESWAEHVGRIMADARYGPTSTLVEYQGRPYTTGGGFSSHINAIEDFTPGLPGNPFSWIPDGLYLDLVDDGPRNEPSVPVRDNIGGFTMQQLFNAFDNDVTSMPQYRVRLLAETGADPTRVIAVEDLFAQYGF